MIQFAYTFGIGIFTQDVAFLSPFKNQSPGYGFVHKSAQQHILSLVCAEKKRVLIFDIVCLWGQLFFITIIPEVYLLMLHALHHNFFSPFLTIFLSV
jgi:hypothetical protein